MFTKNNRDIISQVAKKEKTINKQFEKMPLGE
jgi:hypothetical protein